MYYFDNKFLMYYLNLEVDLKVYVNGEYLQISDAYDVSDPTVGYGYTIYGEPRKFDYREIEHIMVGNKTFNLDQLEKAYGSKEDKPKKDNAEEEKPEDEKSSKKEEGIQMNSYVQNIDPEHPKFQTKGSVVMLDEGWVTYEYYSTESNNITRTTVKRKQVKVI